MRTPLTRFFTFAITFGLGLHLAAQTVVIHPPARLLLASRTYPFKGVVIGAPEGPLVWSVVEGPGRIDPQSGVFAPSAEGLGEVTIAAHLSGFPAVAGRTKVTVLQPGMAEILGKSALASLEIEPDWLKPYLARLPFNDPETDALPPGVPAFKKVEEGPLPRFAGDPGSTEVFASYGLELFVFFDALDHPEARTFLSWGTPGKTWRSREVTGQPSTWVLPDADTRMIKVQSTAPAEGGGFITRKRSSKVRVLGALPLAGRDRNPGHDDGAGSAARFTSPSGLALTDPGRDAWRALVSDSVNNSLRVVTAAGRVLTLCPPGEGALRDGPLHQARFNQPTFLASQHLPATEGKPLGEWVTYVADTGNHVIRCIRNNKVTTFAGTGLADHADAPSADQAAFNRPRGLALDEDGNLLVADSGNFVIRRIDAAPPHAVTTFAGVPGRRSTSSSGPDPGLAFLNLKGLAYIPETKSLAIVDGDRVCILRQDGRTSDTGVAWQGGYVNTEVPLGRPGAAIPSMRGPWGIQHTPMGLLIADQGNHALRLLGNYQHPKEGMLKYLVTLAGDPTIPRARPGLFRPTDLPPHVFKVLYAGLHAPRNLLALPPAAGQGLAILMADGTSLSLLSGLDQSFKRMLPGPLTAPEHPVLGEPIKVAFVPLPNRSTAEFARAPFHWTLELLDRTGRKVVDQRRGGSWGREREEVSMMAKEPGDHMLLLTLLSHDGLLLGIRFQPLEVQPPGPGDLAPPPLAVPPPPQPEETKLPSLPVQARRDPEPERKVPVPEPMAMPELDSDAYSNTDSDGETEADPGSPLPEVKESKLPLEAIPIASNGLTDSGSGPFEAAGVPGGKKRLLRKNLRLGNRRFQHIFERHVAACQVEEGERHPGQFNGAFPRAEAMEHLLADGLREGAMLQETPGTKPDRRVFLCRVPQVGTVERIPGVRETTDFFKIVVATGKDGRPGRVITAFPVPAPSGGLEEKEDPDPANGGAPDIHQDH